jgi:hypothetical protein
MFMMRIVTKAQANTLHSKTLAGKAAFGAETGPKDEETQIIMVLEIP